MADVLAPQSQRWASLIATFATHAERAGFGLVITPLIEHLEVFQRVGDSTDIVRKEMYDFEDKGGRRVAVRPEFTAGIMRAFAEHRPPVPWKAWTAGPAFRYEAPQAGRYRQHFQLDAEIVGTDDPDSDVEIIALLDGFHRALGSDPALAGPQLAGGRRHQGGLPRRAHRLPDGSPRRPLRAEPRDPGHQPAPGARLPTARRPAGRGRRPSGAGVPDRGRRGPLRPGAAGAQGAGHRVRDRSPSRPGARLLQPHAVRVPVPRHRRRPERHRRRWPLQRPGRGPRRTGRHRRCRVRRRHRAASCWPATPRASGRPRRSASARTSSTPWAGTRRWPSPTSCVAPASARTARSTSAA